MIVEFHGDSTQAGLSVYAKPVKVDFPPSELAGLMLGCEVRNLAVPGSTLQDALEKPIIGGKTLTAHVACSDADLIVCNWGINDAYIPGNTPSAHRARWEALDAACGDRLVMQTPNPITVAHAGILNGLITEQRKANIRRVDVHSNVSTYYPNWAAHLSDGIHPNEVLYLYIGKLLWSGLRGMLS